jgi:hypothetical protein
MASAYRNAIFGLLLLAPVSHAQDAATTKGKAIGETINAAITAALPGVSAIDKLIATLFNGKSKQTLTPSDVKKAAASQASKDETSKSTDANSQLASLKGVIAEIASANTLAELAQTAETSLAQARGFLTIPNGWDPFKNQWAIAKTNIASIQKFDSAKLGQISNENVQDAWDNLNTQYEQWKGEIDNFSAKNDLVLTLSSFDKLQTAVHKMATTPSVELRLIAAQLATIKAQPPAKTEFGIAPPPPPPPPSKSGDLSNFIKESVRIQ